MRNILLLLLILSVYACQKAPQEATLFKVEYRGALKNIMHKGDMTAKADLADFQETPHLYALGAVENLKGEILILDSQPFISSAADQKLTINPSFDHKATLLVYATVEKWTSSLIPSHISTYAELETHVEEVARKQGINIDEPFPFLLSGVASSVDWHVVNWQTGDTEHSHQKHIRSGPHGTLTNRKVDILGFYSNSHHAIFTHHSTNMHLHVKTADHQIAGHADGLILGKEMVLKLPVVN